MAHVSTNNTPSTAQPNAPINNDGQNKAQGSNDPNNWIGNNKNAWQLALGILMEVNSKLAKVENKLNKQLHQARAEITSAQADAAKDQAKASVASGISESVSSGVQAGGSLYHGLGTTKSIGEKRALHSDHQKEVAQIDKDLHIEKSKLQVGNKKGLANIANLEAKKKQLSKDYKHKRDLIQSKDGARESHVTAHRAVAQMGQSFGTSYSQAASAQAQNTAQLDGQIAQDLQGSEKATQDVAAQATSINTGQVAVAAVRG